MSISEFERIRINEIMNLAHECRSMLSAARTGAVDGVVPMGIETLTSIDRKLALVVELADYLETQEVPTPIERYRRGGVTRDGLNRRRRVA